MFSLITCNCALLNSPWLFHTHRVVYLRYLWFTNICLMPLLIKVSEPDYWLFPVVYLQGRSHWRGSMHSFMLCCCILVEGLLSLSWQRKQGFTDSFHSAPFPNTALIWTEKILCPLRLLAALWLNTHSVHAEIWRKDLSQYMRERQLCVVIGKDWFYLFTFRLS